MIHAMHYNDVIMSSIASQIASLKIVYSIVYSDADQRKHQSSARLAFVWGIHRCPVNSPHNGPVTRKMFPFDGVIMANPKRWQLDQFHHLTNTVPDRKVQMWLANCLRQWHTQSRPRALVLNKPRFSMLCDKSPAGDKHWYRKSD